MFEAIKRMFVTAKKPYHHVVTVVESPIVSSNAKFGCIEGDDVVTEFKTTQPIKINGDFFDGNVVRIHGGRTILDGVDVGTDCISGKNGNSISKDSTLTIRGRT